jgi:CheY-like chemotaxis protein
MEALRRTFLADGSREVRRMLEFMGTHLDASASARMFHQWIGAAGALGYMEIAERAREAETLLNSPRWTQADLREVLTGLVYEFASPKEASETPIPDSIMKELNRRRVALVGFENKVADKVCAAFEKAGALPLLLNADEPTDSGALCGCSVVMVHVRPETLATAWLRPESSLPAGLPLVLVGGREPLLALDARVQSRACEFLIDGWQPEEVVMRLSFAISRAATSRMPANSRAGVDVLIVDDDVHVLAVVRDTLQNLRMDCRSTSCGGEALQKVRELRPRVAVLDVNMPGTDGFQILSAIRQEGLPVRVVMLTARRHENDVLCGFSLGADDYVMKPFNPLELAARLKRLM